MAALARRLPHVISDKMDVSATLVDGLNLILASRLLLTCGAIAVVVVLLRIRRKRNKRDPTKDDQAPWPAATALKPGGGTPVMHGVRVVELASVAAAPSVGRIFADLGAEVIKVEGPGGAGNGGDPIRDMFLEAASKERVQRNVGIFFEGMHCGKKSVCLDIKKDRGAMIAMLREADVFVTNVRAHQLAGLGLDYDDIKDELPHLVVAHLVAWGREGPDAGLPGYDISSFWSSTGIAHAVHSPPNYMCAAHRPSLCCLQLARLACSPVPMQMLTPRPHSRAQVLRLPHRFRRLHHRSWALCRRLRCPLAPHRDREGRPRRELPLSCWNILQRSDAAARPGGDKQGHHQHACAPGAGPGSGRRYRTQEFVRRSHLSCLHFRRRD
jgi:hypothetical protein